MAAAYPPGLLEEIYKQAFGESEGDEESRSISDDYDGLGMALFQVMLQEKLETALLQQDSDVEPEIPGKLNVIIDHLVHTLY